MSKPKNARIRLLKGLKYYCDLTTAQRPLVKQSDMLDYLAENKGKHYRRALNAEFIILIQQGALEQMPSNNPYRQDMYYIVRNHFGFKELENLN